MQAELHSSFLHKEQKAIQAVEAPGFEPGFPMTLVSLVDTGALDVLLTYSALEGWSMGVAVKNGSRYPASQYTSPTDTRGVQGEVNLTLLHGLRS